MAASEKFVISFRLICINPPPDTGAIRFGLQDKKGVLQAGTPQADGSLLYEFELTAKPGKHNSADFSGPFVQGTAGARFLYLSLGDASSPTPNWIKRVKVPLSGISWQQVEAAHRAGAALESAVDGRGAATVKLLGGGWEINDTM